jgi:hypothetical protein
VRRSKQRLKEPFGKAGLTVAIFALILGMVGGAYAATKLNGTQKKEVEKIAKKFAGKPGANGANGTNGSNGTAGTNGKDGANGTSATTASFTGNEHGCGEGGVIVKSASPEAVVCNGEKGTAGTTGFTETLPQGKTEKGTWALRTDGETAGLASISFSIPLAAGLDSEHVFYLYPPGQHTLICEALTGAEQVECEETVEFEEEVEEHDCTGSAISPAAKPGDLCVYAARTNEGALTPASSANGAGRGLPIQAPVNEEPLANPGTGTSGAVLLLGPPSGETGTVLGWGSWAVTAP